MKTATSITGTFPAIKQIILVLIPLVMIFFITPGAIAQNKLLNYNIMLGNSKIGSINMSKHDSLNLSFIKTSCQAQKRLIFLYTLTEKQEAFFEKGMLVSSHVFRKVNSSVKVDQYTQFSQNYYTVRKGKTSQKVMVKGIFSNQSTLYFAEPVDMKQVYSDVYAAFLNIEKVSDGVYKLILPDGNVNYYYYTNGVCSKVHIERTLFTVEFILVK